VRQEPFRVPEIKDSMSFRPTREDKQNFRILMADRRVTSVSDIIRWAVAQQAEPVRQRWTEAASRIAQEGEADERPHGVG